jgi:hypothetical protein
MALVVEVIGNLVLLQVRSMERCNGAWNVVLKTLRYATGFVPPNHVSSGPPWYSFESVGRVRRQKKDKRRVGQEWRTVPAGANPSPAFYASRINSLTPTSRSCDHKSFFIVSFSFLSLYKTSGLIAQGFAGSTSS